MDSPTLGEDGVTPEPEYDEEGNLIEPEPEPEPPRDPTKEERIEAMPKDALPLSYKSNTLREELVLGFVDNFRSQFVELYPLRRELLLCPPNECGVKKFVCSSVRPTQLPYKQLYDVDSCAKFFADFVEYEPMEDPTHLPNHIISPNTVLQWRKGDSFDLASTLTSILLGAGYDAYCVSGYAPKRVCLADESRYQCPLAKEQQVKKETTELRDLEAETGYKLKPIPDLTSKYDARKVREEAEKTAAKIEVDAGEDWDALIAGDDAADELHGIRVHSWVLVLAGKRDILENSFYVEPATGTMYPVNQSPYIALESIWNNHNYWVNMQDCSRGIDTLTFDLMNTNNWEYIMLDHNRNSDALAIVPESQDAQKLDRGASDDWGTSENLVQEQDAAALEAENSTMSENLLDLSSSWCPKLYIPKSAFDTVAPSRQKTKMYHKCKLEVFADYSQQDGLVQRLTLYDDRERTEARQIRELYRFRKDKLCCRENFVQEGRKLEMFDKGRMPRGEVLDGLKQLEYWSGKRRILEFYPGARIDGLVHREDIFGRKVNEFFSHHDEGLQRRSIHYTLPEDKRQSVEEKFAEQWVPDPGCTDIHKVKEVYEKQVVPCGEEDPNAEPSVSQIKYMVSSGQVGRIEVDYHYKPCRIVHDRRVYSKDGLIEEELVQVDPFAVKPKLAQTNDDLKELQLRFAVANQNIREMERNMLELMRNRHMDEEDIDVVTHVYDASRNMGDEDQKDEEEDPEEEVYDPLKPFLPHDYSGGELELKQAEKVKSECLKNLKQRLVERKEIIEARLLGEQSELDQKRQQFNRQKESLDPSEIDKFEQIEKEALFRINILQMRLEKHNEDAFGKLNDLYTQLKKDERLRKLYE
jgi:hypothetical protein